MKKLFNKNFQGVFLGFAFLLIYPLITPSQIQFQRPKDADPLLDNPQMFSIKRDVLNEAIQKTLKELEISIDEEKSNVKPGILYTKPLVFTKGSLTTGSNLEHVAKRPAGEVRIWTRGRYTLQIEFSPIDLDHTKLSIFARIEGEYQSELGKQWTECLSRGIIEDGIMRAIIKNFGQ